MIQAIMYFGIGFLFASLIGIAVIPMIHARAVRLTLRRVENSIPQSMAEIQADKDLLRAEFAMQARRLEIDVEQLKDKSATQLAELGRKNDVINRLKIEHEAQNVEAVALRTEIDALRNDLGTVRRDLHAPAVGYERHEPDVVSIVPKDWPRAEPARAPLELQQVAKRDDRPSRHENEVLSLVLPRATELTGSDEGLRNPDIVYPPADQRIELSDGAPGMAAVAESVHISRDDQITHKGPSTRGKVSRNIARLCVAGLVGATAAVTWRTYGDQIGERVNSWAKPLDRLLFAAPAKAPPPVASGASTPSETVKQTEAATRAVSEIRNAADQVAAKEEQAADQNSQQPLQAAEPPKQLAGGGTKEAPQQASPQDSRQATQDVEPDAKHSPQPAEQDANQKVVSVAPQARPTQPYPDTKPTTIAGWALLEVVDGTAVVQGPNGVWRVKHGDTVPGVGRVDSIVRWGNRWIVATSKGLISTP
jgi:hypothetical protein